MLREKKKVYMVDIDKMQRAVEECCYQENRVMRLSCEYFGDEVTLIFGQNTPCKFHFISCYTVKFDHYWDDNKKSKPMRALTVPQIPFFMHEILVESEDRFGTEVYKFYIHMPPLKAWIVCKDLQINDVSVNDML